MIRSSFRRTVTRDFLGKTITWGVYSSLKTDVQMAKSEGFVTVWIQRPRLKAKCLSGRWSRLLTRIDRVNISGLYKFLGTGIPLAFGS